MYLCSQFSESALYSRLAWPSLCNQCSWLVTAVRVSDKIVLSKLFESVYFLFVLWNFHLGNVRFILPKTLYVNVARESLISGLMVATVN